MQEFLFCALYFAFCSLRFSKIAYSYHSSTIFEEKKQRIFSITPKLPITSHKNLIISHKYSLPLITSLQFP